MQVGQILTEINEITNDEYTIYAYNSNNIVLLHCLERMLTRTQHGLIPLLKVLI